MAVELADDVEQVGSGDLTPEKVVGGDGPADERGRAPAQPPGRRNRVLLHEPEVGVQLAELSMNFSMASNVAGTGSGSCTRPRITSGSLSPCPVNTLTTVPSGPLPSPASFMRPAIPAAEAGSQNTPSSL